MLAHKDREVEFRTEVVEGDEKRVVDEVFDMDNFDTDVETFEARRKALNANVTRETPKCRSI